MVHRHHVATLAAKRVYYAPHIEVLDVDHPDGASSPRHAPVAARATPAGRRRLSASRERS
jgi:hypothetical protein